MQPTSNPKSRKRALSISLSEEASNTQNVRNSRPHHRVLELERAQVEIEEASDSGLTYNPLDSRVSERQLTISRGHDYGPSTVCDNGSLQNGDAFYQTGPASQIFGPSILNGDMRVQLSNTFYSCNHNLPRHNPEDDQERALKSLLYYTTMDDRKAQLARVQPASLEWVWTTQLPLWLEKGENIFWISGKPASGKSTLMHHLSIDKFGSKRVLRHLQLHRKNWILVHFYFDFRAGDGTANTTLGMLRSLLLQLIDKSAEFKTYVLGRCKHRLDGGWPELESELLALICGAVSSTSISVCGFVDGLDEYKGHLGKLVSLLQEVQKISSIKLCLASRPETKLRHHLRECPSFAMQDYNQGTIEAYIEAATADVNELVDVQQLRDVFTEVVMRNANGVILWAVFAIDEAVKVLLCGCTLAEVRKRLQLFPQELFSVYRRIWDCLVAEDQRLAAVMFFVIESWDSSFDRTMGNLALSSRYLMVLARSIVRKLDPGFEIEPDYTELNFRLKTHALLGGLIEGLGEAKTVRLAHKSVQSFLHQLPVYVEWRDKISQVVEVGVLGPKTFVDATRTVCDALVPEATTFWKLLKRNLPEKPFLYQFLNYLTCHLEGLNKRKPVDCIIETLHCVSEYVAYAGSDGFDVRRPSHFHTLDHTNLTSLLISVSQTWLIRDYIIPYYLYTSKKPYSVHFPQYIAFEALQQKLRAVIPGRPRIEVSCLLNDHPELLYLARYCFSYAFTATVDTERDLSRTDCELLFRIVLWEWRVISSSPPRETEARMRILVPILKQLPWQARFITLLGLPALGGALDMMNGSEQRPDFLIRPSLWWPFKEIHALCVWAWTCSRGDSLGRSDAFADAGVSLDALVDAGASFEHDVFEEGNVLHALFKYDPWSTFQGTTSRRRVRHSLDDIMSISSTEFGHFNISKFMALVSKGADIHACGLYGTVRQAAEHFLGSMRRIPGYTYHYKREMNQVQEAIAYIDSASEAEVTIGAPGSIDNPVSSKDDIESRKNLLRRTGGRQPLPD